MGKTLHRLYLRFRSPKIFLIALSSFIVSSLYLHYTRGYDADLGATNLSLSIEASVASAVITVAAEETIRLLRAILKIVQEHGEILATQKQMLATLLSMAEAARDHDQQQLGMLLSMKETDERLLKTLTEKED